MYYIFFVVYIYFASITLGNDDFITFLSKQEAKELHVCNVGGDLPNGARIITPFELSFSVSQPDNLQEGDQNTFQFSHESVSSSNSSTSFYWRVRANMTMQVAGLFDPTFYLRLDIEGQTCPFNEETIYDPKTKNVSCPTQFDFSATRLPWQSRIAAYSVIPEGLDEEGTTDQSFSGLLTSDATLGNKRWEWSMKRTIASMKRNRNFTFHVKLDLLDPVGAAKELMIHRPESVSPTKELLTPFSPDLNDVEFTFDVQREHALPTIYANRSVLSRHSLYFERLFGPGEGQEMITTSSHFSRGTILGMLEYCYTGRVERYQQKSWVELQKAAIFYQIPTLEVYVMTEYMRNINENWTGRHASGVKGTAQSSLDKSLKEWDATLGSKWRKDLVHCSLRGINAVANYADIFAVFSVVAFLFILNAYYGLNALFDTPEFM
jgi:hypothetical protein